ncbi:MAG: M23 family metallopeptidase [Bacillota bacterium]
MAGGEKPSLIRSLLVLVILGVLALTTWAGWRVAAAADQRRREEARREAEAAAAEAARPSYTARLVPWPAVDQGDYVVVVVESTAGRVITGVEATVFDAKLPLYQFAQPVGTETAQVYYSSFAVGSARKAGDYAVSLRVTDSRGVEKTETLPFTVREKKFEVQRMTVTGQNAALAADASAWAYDREKVNAAKAHPTAKPLWDGDFIKPLEGEISTEFGQVRYVNGVLTSRHSGLDLEAPMGAVIHAVNSGLVVFVGPLKISGNTVIIDHGLGYFSSYNHMSKFSVKAGDSVLKGQEIGRVGSTGFSTSAHLHWTMTVGLTGVSPWLFIGKQPPLPFASYVDTGK